MTEVQVKLLKFRLFFTSCFKYFCEFFSNKFKQIILVWFYVLRFKPVSLWSHVIDLFGYVEGVRSYKFFFLNFDAIFLCLTMSIIHFFLFRALLIFFKKIYLYVYTWLAFIIDCSTRSPVVVLG